MERTGTVVKITGVLTFLGECPTGSVAARLCPVRAEPVYPAEVNGVVRCSCKSPFFGKNCRFKEQNGTVDVNGTRVSDELVMISWKEKKNEVEGRRYLVQVRKIQYKLSLVGFGKWRKAAIHYTELDGKMTAYSLPSTPYTALLRLPADTSFEVKITTINIAGDLLGSSSLYFDASNEFESGKMLATSRQIHDFESYILESFQNEPTLKGIVIGGIIGSLGALMLMVLVYGLTRFCRKRKQQRGPGLDAESKQEHETKEVTSEDVETSLSIENVSPTSSYIIIDMKDIEVKSMTAPIEATATVPAESSKAEKASSPDTNSVSTGNTVQETTRVSETVDITGYTSKECNQPDEPEIIVDNTTIRTIWDAYDYI